MILLPFFDFLAGFRFRKNALKSDVCSLRHPWTARLTPIVLKKGQTNLMVEIVQMVFVMLMCDREKIRMFFIRDEAKLVIFLKPCLKVAFCPRGSIMVAQQTFAPKSATPKFSCKKKCAGYIKRYVQREENCFFKRLFITLCALGFVPKQRLCTSF